MKRKLEHTLIKVDESTGSDSSCCEDLPTNPSSSIRNTNRSKRYIDNILPSHSIQQDCFITNRSPSSESNTLSFPFVSAKVITNGRHLKLRKQLKTCSNFSSSYFVLDMNAPSSTSTIGFMESNRGNDIPVLLNDSNNAKTPSRKKTKRNAILPMNSNKLNTHPTNNTPCTIVSNVSNKKEVNKKKKKKKKRLASVNTTVSCSPSSTLSPNNNHLQASPIQANPYQNLNFNNNRRISCNPITNNEQENFIQNDPIFQPFTNSLFHTNLEQTCLNSNNNEQVSNIPPNISNVQNTINSNFFQQPSIETLLNCFANSIIQSMTTPEFNSPQIGIFNYSNSCESPISVTPPSVSNASFNSPQIGILMNGNTSIVNNSTQLASGSSLQNQSNATILDSYNQNMLNNPTISHNNSTNNMSQLSELLTQDETRILLNAFSMYMSGNYQIFQ